MKGVVLTICPDATVIDLSHEVPPFDIRGGGFVLWAGSRGYPSGTIHLAVVDPGVGSERRPVAVQVGHQFYVGPDNGLFWMVAGEGGEEVRAVELHRPEGASPTFEGRDVFAPAAAWLARGKSLDGVGTPIHDLVQLPDLGPAVVWVDGFGNLITNLRPPVRPLRIGGRLVSATAETYSEGRPGEPFRYTGSLGFVEIGVREGRAADVLRAGPGTRIEETPT